MSTKKIQILGSLNADTLDGKHAEEFALVADLEDLQIKVDDTATQINSAVSQKSQVQIVTQDNVDIVPILKIHKLTQEEYDQGLKDGTIEENALYLTPDVQTTNVQIITWEADD